MPYTLVKWLAWLLLAAITGGVIGYLLRGVRCRSELAAARATTVDEDEVLTLRRRVSDLELAVVDRDRFEAERDDLRQQLNRQARAAAPAVADVPDTSGAPEVRGFAATQEVLEATAAAESEAAESEAPLLDDASLAAGAAVLGRTVRRNDLTVIEGIGPKIAELLGAAGITTWWGLATGGVEPLATALTAAGPRFQMHDPATWPTQAGLLAHGRWDEFKALTDRLDGGRDA